jgi:hypothetical protein
MKNKKLIVIFSLCGIIVGYILFENNKSEKNR